MACTPACQQTAENVQTHSRTHKPAVKFEREWCRKVADTGQHKCKMANRYNSLQYPVDHPRVKCIANYDYDCKCVMPVDTEKFVQGIFWHWRLKKLSLKFPRSTPLCM